MDEVANRWQVMSEEQKDPYWTKARDDKARYDQELLEYKQRLKTSPAGNKENSSECSPMKKFKEDLDEPTQDLHQSLASLFDSAQPN